MPARRLRSLALAFCAICSDGLAQDAPPEGDAPLSAIDWLTESLRAAPSAPGPEARSSALDVAPVTTRPLGESAPRAVGILPPPLSGLPVDFWGTLSAEALARLLREAGAGVPAARELYRKVLLAEIDTPASMDGRPVVMLARLDALLAVGALEPARELVRLSGLSDPEIFRRGFDIGVLTNETRPFCAALRDTPDLSPTLPTRIFCLARGGDWSAAETTLVLGAKTGRIDPREEHVLGWFLDPDLFEGTEPPGLVSPVSALEFMMREAVALPRPTGPLPPAFLWHDLDPHVPLRQRIAAAERLTLTGALAPWRLMEIYRSGTPSASGGLWDRAAAVQELDAVLASTDPKAVDAALANADERLTESGLRFALATAYAPWLADLPRPQSEPARLRRMELLLLAGAAEAAQSVIGRAPSPAERALLQIAGADEPPAGAPALPPDAEPHLSAAWSAFHLGPPDSLAARQIAQARAENGAGAGLLTALHLLRDGHETAPTALQAALWALRDIGQEDAARRIALDTLLGQGRR